MARTIYLIGSLRNPAVPELAQALRAEGHEVFDDWFAGGPEADEWWQRYEQGRGRGYREAMDAYHAWHVFNFDRYHLDRCDTGVLLMPAGRSAHLELGYLIGQGKDGYVLFDEEPERYDVMYRFCQGVFFDQKSLVKALK